jgi:uncharacterized membrane protein YbhN (UPF0104 family)
VFDRFFPQRAAEGASEPPAPRARAFVRWAPVVLVLGACAYIGASVDVAQLRASLLSVDVAPLGSALALAALAVVAHAAYWRTLVRTTADVPLRAMTAYTFASYAANTLLPLRAGEALRVWLVRRHHGVPLALSGAVIAIEKVADVTSMLVVVAPLPWLVPGLPPSVARALHILPFAVCALLVVVALASRSGLRWKFLSGFEVVRSVRVAALGFAFVLLAWVLDIGAILSILAATHIGPSLGKALVVILLVNLAIAIPSTPGQVGTHELGSTVALRLLGVPPEQAIAFALFYHLTQLAPVLVLGLYSARLLSRLPEPA